MPVVKRPSRGTLLPGLLVAGFLAALVGSAEAQKSLGTAHNPTRTLTVSVESLFEGIPPHGFLPLRVRIENDGGSAVSVLLETTSRDNHYYRGENNATASFSLSAEAGKDTEHEILVPLVPSYSDRSGYGGYGGRSIAIKVSGGGVETPYIGDNSDFNVNLPCVALSTESRRLNWDDVRNTLESGVGSSGRTGGSFGARFAPDRLPAGWRGLSGFDIMVFREDEWAKVAPSARAAVLDWMRMGGRLVFWGREGKTPQGEDLGFPADTTLGLGSVAFVVGQHANNQNANLITKNELVGVAGRPEGFVDAVSDDYHDREWTLPEIMGIRTFDSRQVIFILIAFAVIVGPVNLFMLAKPGRRHRLFFTTPLISIVASLIIAGLIFIQDGFGGKGVRASLTYLDSGARKAYLNQEQLARTGVLLGRSFALEDPVAITPLVMGRSRWTFVDTERRGNGLGYEISDKSFAGDWFRSRSEQAHLVQAVTPTRESVQVLAAETGPDGRPVVLSTLAYPLARLVYVDDDEGVWTGENIGTGAKATLTKWEKKAFHDWWNGEAKTLGVSLRGMVPVDRSAGFRGHFFAVAAENAKPPVVETLSSIRWANTKALVFGSTETIGKGGPPAP